MNVFVSRKKEDDRDTAFLKTDPLLSAELANNAPKDRRGDNDHGKAEAASR